MCGIVGVVDRGSTPLAALKCVIADMTATLAHRGPDDSGVWLDGDAGVALGHRRLSVIDLSPLGHQPMVSSCGRYVITFNGEIYNFRDLRRQLDDERFRGDSDTEVFLTATARWGLEAALKKANGMFAFGLWDRRERRMFLGRDRAGEKPLYYGWVGKAFVFGSELKALMLHPDFTGELDRAALTQFFRFNCIPTPYSPYRGIHKLAPGCYLEVDAATEPGTEPGPQPYWSARAVVEAAVANRYKGSMRDAAEELEIVLRDAVQLRTYADVPVGAFLSGGIDSSLVVALMQRVSNARVRTFTIGYEDAEFDEARYAAQVAKSLETDHTDLIVTADDVIPLIPRLPTLYDEPFADSSQLPTTLVSRLARKSVTVVLTGDGGDELFGGYHRHFRRTWQYLRKAPVSARRHIARLARLVSKAPWPTLTWRDGHGSAHRLRIDDKAWKLSKVLPAASVEEYYLNLVSHFRSPAEVVLDSREPVTYITSPDAWAELDSPIERMMFLDLITYLTDDILAKVDRATMSTALEARVPFLDSRVIEFAWRLPLSMKVGGGKGKVLLRSILAKYVPPDLTERRKTGFGIPVHTLLAGPLREWAESLMTRANLEHDGLLDCDMVGRLWRAFLQKRECQHQMWVVLMFLAWRAETASQHREVNATRCGPDR